MSDQIVKSDLFEELSTDEQQLVAGGWGRGPWGGGRWGGGPWGGGRWGKGGWY
ncbi:hypothetical protein VB735_09555 [Halotia wernerae UHCC 0503]|nr:hypothetical protein [Halotia wernerae UHCC 0503]